MPQIGFTNKTEPIYDRFNALRRAYEDENGGGRVYNPDFLSILMDKWEEAEMVANAIDACMHSLPSVSVRDYIADAETNDPELSIDPRIGKRVRCLYKNSGHKFYSKFLDTNPVILEVRKNSGSAPDSFRLGFKGGDDWWYCNDFEILEPQNETK